MGCIIACEKCPSAVRNSVITFSEEFVDKIIDGIEPEPLTPKEIYDRQIPDYAWFEKLHCIDDSHTFAYGLSVESVNQLMSNMEKLTKMKKGQQCSPSNLIECLKRAKCSSNCMWVAKVYIDCTDELRAKQLLAKMEMWAKEEAEAEAAAAALKRKSQKC